MKNFFQYDLKYPTFKEGLDEIKNHITRNNIRGVVTISADIHRAIAFSNSSGEPREYIVGPIAANIKCSKKNFYESLGYFFMCDSYNYLTIDVTVEHGKPTAEVKYFDDKNKLRYREKFKSNK